MSNQMQQNTHQIHSGTDAYLAKTGSYFQGVRADYIAALPSNPEAAILELGCSEGSTGALALAQGKCRHYMGIELHEPSAAIARTRLTEVHVGNIETMPLPFAPASFDALIISEVLEHLVDPWAVLARLAPLVRPGGLVFASSPNISHHKVIRSLLRGRWDLADQGVMDRTHLRWFTPATYAGMFEGAGFQIEEIRPVRSFGWKPRLFNRLTGSRWQHLFMPQTSIRGRKSSARAGL
jgi:2-polyprenyl-3-methyl-5-hydroxy-6-metoxy-1,4-benzoquinol methylase